MPDESPRTPPEVQKIAVPTGRGRPAKQWLEAQGLVSRIPPIRSSDIAVLSDPFGWYISRRLSLVPAFSRNASRDRGTWLHKAYETSGGSGYAQALEARLKELTAICEALGTTNAELQKVLETERHDAATALVWYKTSQKVRIPGSEQMKDGWLKYLERDYRRTLGHEVTLIVNDPNYKWTPLLAQFDSLHYNSRTRSVWAVDLKTTDNAETRALSCPVEFQTRHYLNILKSGLQAIIDTYGLPPDTKAGGILHVTITRPNIKFGENDRHYTYRSEGKRSGVTGTAIPHALDKGKWTMMADGPGGRTLVKDLNELEAVGQLHEVTGKTPEKVYVEGPPSIELYERRCEDWYLGRGDFLHLAPERDITPPVNISTSPITVLDEDAEAEYQNLLTQIHRYATIEAWPVNFPRIGSSMLTYGRQPSAYAPLYVAPVREWPALCRHLRLIHSPREKDLNPDLPPGIHP